MNLDRLDQIVYILKQLDPEANQYPCGKGWAEVHQVMTPQQVLEYAEEISLNDAFWKKLPERIALRVDEEELEEDLAMFRTAFGPEVTLDELRTASRDSFRRRLQLLIVLCDAPVGSQEVTSVSA